MITKKNVVRLVDFGAKKHKDKARSERTDADTALSLNRHENDVPRLARKPKDLVGLLLGYGARARRASMPRVTVYLEVFTPAGNSAVQIRFKQS